MLTDRLITVAIHTYERAHKLKSILESEGISVVLQNVNLTNPSISAGVRVRIKECDLPLALRLIENIEILSPQALSELNSANAGVLVPVDFSDSSMRAVEMAFRIASLNNSQITLLHSYIDPAFSTQSAMQLTDTLTFDPTLDVAIDPEAELQEEKTVLDIAHGKMDKLCSEIRERIKTGVLPAVKFTTTLLEGLPEEMINEYAETHKTMLIVMGTHGAGSRERELLGSVTAEVLDACKAPVLTVPPDISTSSLSSVENVVFFASPSQEDILALDALYRTLPETPLKITLVRMPRGRFSSNAPDAMDRLLKYCRENYPAYQFKVSGIVISNPVDDLTTLTESHKVDMIVIATRRKNIFSRLFNPSWAHRLLFHADIPLMSIPVQS
ncbi:MAG: universal stress protein [Muribaculaceae bacterium]|nr:universal stress protein [Muribaculaceae bacterium]